MSTPWLIVGAGYTGGRLASRLAARGESVVATRRCLAGGDSAEPAAASVQWRALDLDALPAELELPARVAVYCAPPGAPPGLREERLIAALRGCVQLVYVSSTGVYAPGRGQWVDEDWPLAPQGELGQARLIAERAVQRAAAAAGLRCAVLRAAGIHGPGRGLVARVRRGEARVLGDGAAHVSRIHVDDLVTAICAAADRGFSGVVNCGDDDPAPHGVVLDGVAALIGEPPPPRVAPETASAAARAMLLADRKICNRRLRDELGVALRCPSWVDAVRLERAAPGEDDSAS